MSELKTRFIDDTYSEYFNTGNHELAQIYLKSEADKVIKSITEGAISMFRDSNRCRGLDLESPLGRIANAAFKHWCFVESISSKNTQLQEDKERLLQNNHHLLDEVERLKEDVADFRQLPFSDESFYHVIFDPPYLVNVGDTSYMAKKYGKLPKDWKNAIKKGFDECWRVLKTHGTLVFKWNAVQIPAEDVIESIGRRPLYGNRCGKQNRTHWMVFFKEAK